MMRVLTTGPELPPLKSPLNYLAEDGHEIVHIGMMNPLPGSSALRFVPFARTTEADMPGIAADGTNFRRHVQAEAPHARSVADQVRPNLAHAFALHFGAACFAAADLHPLIISPWGYLGYLQEKKPAELLPQHRAVLEKSDAILVETPILAERLSSLLPPSIPIYMVQVGTDGQVFRKGYNAQLPQWRRALDIPEDAAVVLSPRGWAAEYNHDQVLQAFAEAYPRLLRPSVLMFLAMPRTFDRQNMDTLIESVKRQSGELGVSDRVRWLPALPQPMLPTLYNLADVIVSYARSDGAPVTVIEAVACERPVIVSRLLAFRGTFIERCCTQVELNNAPALAEAMIAILNQPPSTTQLVLARQEVMAECDKPVVKRKLLSIYESVL